MRIGYSLNSEEYAPADLIRQAELAEEAGFASLWIADHYHPWTGAQGQSPFVWSMIGALSRTLTIPIMTGVTCPIIRMHPAILAQAAATTAVLTGGRFIFGVGTGEALNEHIIGEKWPEARRRLAMLEEAIEIMRELWSGRVVTHHGAHYTVEHARLYTIPQQPIPVYVSGLGRTATELAARVGDGYVSTKPDPHGVARFRKDGGGSKPAVAGTKACWAPTRDEARQLAHRLWASDSLPGELAQVLPTPEHFEQASQLVTPDMLMMAYGPDLEPHLAMVESYRKAGYDTLHVGAVGPHYEEMIRLYRDEIIPRFRE
ncbi:TIGR03557 family F420-dependent LLM class oxidoreductase [Rugosimonospora acidiphila]